MGVVVDGESVAAKLVPPVPAVHAVVQLPEVWQSAVVLPAGDAAVAR